MESRSLGDDGRAVSRLGLGLAALGRPAYHTLDHGADFPEGRSPEQLQRRAHAVLDAAFEAGIRYVDVARSYGAAEAFVRSWAEARGLSPAQVVVGSKWGYRYVGGWRIAAGPHEIKDHSVASFQAQREETLSALGPLLSLYQIHSVTADSPVLGDAAVLDELARLKDQGIRIGVTVSGPAQADAVARALDVERGGAPLFDAIQATWNLLERSCERRLRDAHAAGRRVIVKESLANGLLTRRGSTGTQGALADIASAWGKEPDAVAVAAALAQPWADVVLLGATSVEQLRSNLGALHISLDADAQERLHELAQDPADYWRRRAALPWT